MKKVLIITYYWPPAGGPGVQRWLKFVKYLRDFNIEPVLFIPKNPNYPITDAAFLKEIPEGIKIIKQSIFEPYQLASFLSSKKTKRISSGIIQTKFNVVATLSTWADEESEYDDADTQLNEEFDDFEALMAEGGLLANMLYDEQTIIDNSVPVSSLVTVGRNDPCPCGSGKKYKKCCGA